MRLHINIVLIVLVGSAMLPQVADARKSCGTIQTGTAWTTQNLNVRIVVRRGDVSCRYARYVMKFFFHHRSSVGNKGGANAPGWNCAVARIGKPYVGSCSRDRKLVTAYRD